jgi:hypothetical protein
MKFCVDIMEYERGWGSRRDEVKVFDSADAAYKFQEEFNSENTADAAPDWYMVAGDPYRVS